MLTYYLFFIASFLSRTCFLIAYIDGDARPSRHGSIDTELTRRSRSENQGSLGSAL